MLSSYLVSVGRLSKEQGKKVKDLGSKSVKKLQKSGGEIWFVVNDILDLFFMNLNVSFSYLTCYLILYSLYYQTLRARVSAKTEEKKLELLFLRWSEHHKKLCNFIR